MSVFRGYRVSQGVVALAATLPIGDASCASLQALGLFPGLEEDRGLYEVRGVAVSGDGSTILGQVSRHDRLEYIDSFKWTVQDGAVALGTHAPDGQVLLRAAGLLSEDGTTIAGSIDTPGYSHQAALWTAAGGTVGLGSLPNDRVENYSGVWGLSRDGKVVVGDSHSTKGTEAYVWTQETGMVMLGRWDGRTPYSIAHGVSDDGSVVVGQAAAFEAYHAFRWTATDGLVDIGPLESGYESSYAQCVSADGSIVAGYGKTSHGIQWFVWDTSQGMRVLRNHEDPSLGGFALDMDAAGRVVVGRSNGHSTAANALVWTESAGLVNVWDVLLADGLDPSAEGWTSLTNVQSVSDDGRTLVGYGVRNGDIEGFVATIPQWDWVTDDIRGDLDGDGVVGMQDVLGFVMALVSPQEYEQVYGLDLKFRGDVNRDGVMNLDDVTPFADLLNLDTNQRAALFAAVPEPTTGLLLMALLGVAGGRRQRGSAR